MAWDIGADEYSSGGSPGWDIGADEYSGGGGSTDRAAIITAVEFEAPPPVPSDPTTVAVTGVTSTTISISWVDPNDPDVPIRPYFRKSVDTIWNLASVSLPAGTTVYTFEDLDAGTEYDVGVAAWVDPLLSNTVYDTDTTTAAARTAIVTAIEFEIENAPRAAIVTAVEFQTTDEPRTARIMAVEFAYDEVVRHQATARIVIPTFPEAPPAYERLNEEEFRKLVRDGFAGADDFVQRAIAEYYVEHDPQDGDVLTWNATTRRWEAVAPA